ncbi:MAG: radical SAM protein [Elusimicrobia bacterium]|nr:radical SAM protein [Elusimicrobiota bacterium]
MKLCLLVTSRCNLRCGFCQVDFTNQDMSWETAWRAVSNYLRHLSRGQNPQVKFLGGEPLLNWRLIFRLIEAGRTEWKGRRIRYELPTNGSFLDAQKIAYLKDCPEVEVTLSQRVTGASSLPGVWYTLVLDQNCRPERVLRELTHLIREGYRRFNILPAYFVPWNEDQVSRFQASLEIVRRTLGRLRNLGIRIKNLEVWSPVPLYNEALTVDKDGAVYASNMVQCRGMEQIRRILCLGNVHQEHLELAGVESRRRFLMPLLARWAGPEAWQSTRRVDQLLTEFVHNFPR